MDFTSVNQPQSVDRLASQKNICRHVQIIQDIQLLVDETDAEPHGVLHVTDGDGLAIQLDFTGIRLIHAAQDFHQGGFARAVLAAERRPPRRGRSAG